MTNPVSSLFYVIYTEYEIPYSVAMLTELTGNIWTYDFICYFFNFKNVSKLCIFNEVLRGIDLITNNYEPSYLTTRPVRDELPEIQFLS